jgi:hypothetical protein
MRFLNEDLRSDIGNFIAGNMKIAGMHEVRACMHAF